MAEIIDVGWRMESIRISFNDWGDYKGKYTGKIEFKNREQEAFVFNIRPEMAEEYLRLIKGELTSAASQLGERLMQSLNLLPKPEEKKQIGTEIAILKESD